MKKTNWIKGLFLTLLLVLSFGMTSLADNDRKVVDMADLLDDSEEEKLQEQLLEIAEAHRCDVVVATTDSCEGKSPQDFTDDFYYENGYGYGDEIDGIILMVSMEERKFHFATRGRAIRIFTDYGLQRMDDLISEDLSDGAYYSAFERFGDLAEQFMVEYEEEGRPFDVGHEYEEKMSMGVRLLIALGVGLVISLIVFLVLLGQLKTVAPEKRAHEYIRKGSFRVTRARDIFLYNTVNRRKKEKNSGGGSSTHSTSDGGSAGGHTGSF